MKNIVFALGLMFTSGSALAAEPLYLTFRLSNGAERSFRSNGLSMTVSGDMLLISNEEMQAELSIGSLVSMRFTEKALSGVMEINDSDSVTVYSLKGEKVGEFKTAAIAEKTLPVGSYILKSADKSIKKIIK